MREQGTLAWSTRSSLTERCAYKSRLPQHDVVHADLLDKSATSYDIVQVRRHGLGKMLNRPARMSSVEAGSLEHEGS